MKKVYYLLMIVMLIACASCNNEWESEQYVQMVSFKAPVNAQGVTPVYIRYKPNGKVTYQLPLIVSGSTMNAKELEEIGERLFEYLEQALQDKAVDAVVFMLTNIIKESTHLIFTGQVVNMEELVETAFQKPVENHCLYVEGLVSRKKQLIPALTMAVQQQ